MTITRNPDGLVFFPICGWFAEQVCDSFSGGWNELEAAACCLSDEIAQSLRSKIYTQLESNNLPNITLWLTDEEAMCLGIAGTNCKTGSMPKAQRDRLDYWLNAWLASSWADPDRLLEEAA